MEGSKTYSVLQGYDKKCYMTDREYGLHKHHIYYGRKNREVSDKNGFWVWLIPEYHNTSELGVHKGNHELDLALKEVCQSAYEETHTREEFRTLIGKSYL